jgi:hypothetical protein
MLNKMKVSVIISAIPVVEEQELKSSSLEHLVINKEPAATLEYPSMNSNLIDRQTDKVFCF